MRQISMFAILGSLILFTTNNADADSYYGGHGSYGHGSAAHGDYGHDHYGHYGYDHNYGYGFENGRYAGRSYRVYRGRGCDNFGFRDGGQRRSRRGNCPGGRCFDRPLPIDRGGRRLQNTAPPSPAPNSRSRTENRIAPNGPKRALPQATVLPIPGAVPPNREEGPSVPNTNVNP